MFVRCSTGCLLPWLLSELVVDDVWTLVVGSIVQERNVNIEQEGKALAFEGFECLPDFLCVEECEVLFH
jgi:hypothetical protein